MFSEYFDVVDVISSFDSLIGIAVDSYSPWIQVTRIEVPAKNGIARIQFVGSPRYKWLIRCVYIYMYIYGGFLK